MQKSQTPQKELSRIQDLGSDYVYYAIMADQGRIFRKVLESISASSALLLGVMFVGVGYQGWPDLFLPISIVAPAYVWGSLMLVLGSLRVLVIIVNGWWPYSHRVRKWLSGMFIFGIWLPMAACFWWSFQEDAFAGSVRSYPGIAYALFTLGTEFLIYYAHSSFVYAARR